MQQVTLAKVVATQGVGLHGGVPCEVVLRPRTEGGVLLCRLDDDSGEFLLHGQAGAALAEASPLCTRLVNADGVGLATVEHLLAALHGLGVTSVTVEIGGPEVPILDGSALPWVELIDAAGRVEVRPTTERLVIERAARYDAEGRVLLAEPGQGPRWRERLEVGCTIDFPHPAIGRQTWQGVVDEAVFRREIAPARTFTLEREVQAAQRAGLIKGGSLANAVVFGDAGQVLNLEGLRFPDEPVRHKVLDFLGDTFLTGQVLAGVCHLTAPGHTANNGLLRAVLAANALAAEIEGGDLR